MTTGYPWSAIVLYLDKETPGTLEELVIRFGSKRTQRDGSGYLHAAWCDLMPEVTLEERKWHRVLRLDMAIHALGEHLVRDDGQVVAEAFRDGCEALRPQVGMFLNWNTQADPEWLEQHYWAILGLSANYLLDLGAGLLYLNAEFASYVTAKEVRLAHRECLPVSEGLLVFSTRSPNRWG